MTDAPNRINALPTRWHPDHGPETDWRKGDWTVDTIKSPLATEYVRADLLATAIRERDEARSVVETNANIVAQT